jgi:hypothetical protein
MRTAGYGAYHPLVQELERAIAERVAAGTS